MKKTSKQGAFDAQYQRTLKRTGKWRGKKHYTKFKRVKKQDQPAILQYPDGRKDFIFNRLFKYWNKPEVGFFVYQPKLS